MSSENQEPIPTGCRVLVFGAHPDDAEIFAGGLLVRHCRAGSVVKIVSVTDGSSGHHQLPPDRLAMTRRNEAAAAGNRIGAEYVTWDFPDGRLEPNLAVREAIIREIRQFRPDVILTHRPHDYHPDHRAVGTAVQDASYLVTVPLICPEVPALRRDPVVAYMVDQFTRPNVLRPDIVLDIAPEFDLCVQMAACHASQFFEWLPYHDGILESVPEDENGRYDWLRNWLQDVHHRRHAFFTAQYADQEIFPAGKLMEVYEVSEYAGQLPQADREHLFPGAL